MAETGAWMPMYWADYLADTIHLTTVEHGAYLLLIATYWRTGKPLKDDDRYLAAMTRMRLEKWKAVREKLIALFTQQDGQLIHKRVEKEILRSSDRLNSARANGKAGGLAKSKLVTVTVHNKEERKKEGTQLNGHAAARGTRLPPDWQLPQDWKDWAAQKRPSLDIDTTAEMFRNYWVATSGTKGTKLDWLATWKNWVIKQQNIRLVTNGRRPLGVGG